MTGATSALRERAVELHRAGDLAGAEPLYALLLEADGRDPELLYLLAVLRFQQGRAAEAVAAARRAIRARPGDAGPHALAGLAEAARGRFAEAVAAYGRALGIAPDRWDVLTNRAASLAALGRPAEALADCDRALALAPGAAEAMVNRGDALRDLGRPAEALAAYAGAELAEAGARRDALLLPLAPAEAAGLLAAAAELLARDGARAAALDAFEQARALLPNDPDLLNRGAILLGEFGRLDEAVALLDRAIALAPGAPALFHNYGLLGRFAPSHPHLARLAAIDAGKLGGRDAATLHFARAKAASDLGDPVRAFAHLLDGNALVRADIAHDPADYERLAGRLRAAFPAPTALPRPAPRRDAGGAPARPVFVVGMPRSGSTLVERVIAGHPAAVGIGEADAFRPALAEVAGPDPGPGAALGSAALRRLGAAYRARLPRMPAGAAVVVDKTLVNAWYAGLIHRALPEARIVQVWRDPVDTCLSCFEQLFNAPQPFAYDLGDLGRYHRALSSAMAHWRAVLPGEVLLDVGYEALVADPEGQARRLLAHCGLDWDPACLDLGRPGGRVGTASVAQVRRPVSAASVGRWRRHADRLAPLLDALGLDAEGRPA